MPLLASARVPLGSARIGALRVRRRLVLALLVGLVLTAALIAVVVPRAQAGVPGHRPGAVGAAAHDAAALRVNPFPGTPDAATNAPIIFSSLAPSDLESVAVTGSRSGRHRGRIERLPDGAGTEFLPRRPFTPGEQVSVSAGLSSPAAGTASGAPGATRLSFSFGVAVINAGAVPPSDGSPPAGAGGGSAKTSAGAAGGPTKSFHSRPDLHPSVVSVSSDPDTTSGDIFVSPDHASQMGPMILSPQGQLVWFRAVPPGDKASNLAVQTYHGHPVLTYWQGKESGADGEDVIVNRHYKTTAVVHPVGNGYSADLHDFQVIHGKAFLITVVAVKANLSSVGGPKDGYVWDNIIQEVDIATGKLLWEWHSYGHIPLNASHKPPQNSYYDFVHLNSIQPLPDGSLLVSSRSTWSVYKIDMPSGKIDWTLGGKYNQFKRGTGVGWSWQHDARRNGNTLTLFDDGAAPQEEQQSAGKSFSLNVANKSVTLIHRYTHSPPLLASAQGSMQLLPDGNAFVGWGTEPDFSEYTPDGKQIFTGSFALGQTSYRAFRFPWSGQPLSRPAVAVAPTPDGHVDVWASWDGATDVSAWRVVGGSSPSHLNWMDKKRFYSFETQITLGNQPRYFAVQALNSNKQVLGTSKASAVPGHVNLFGSMAFVRRGGSGSVPVGCFTGKSCSVTLTITSGKSVLAHTKAESVAAGRGGLVGFQLSSSGVQKLGHASRSGLPVEATVRDSSGATATAHLDLVPFSVRGNGPSGSLSQSPTIQIVGTTQLVSRQGVAAVLAACYAGRHPCDLRGRITSSGKRIGRLRSGHLGIDELGFIYINLTGAGRSMLAHASGNQLAAKVKLTSGNHTASGHVALSRYN